MTVMSGRLLYQWTPEIPNYGIVQPYANGSLQLLQDYDTLKERYSSLNITLLETANETATSLQPLECDVNRISNPGFARSFDIPPQPPGAAELISNGVVDPPSGALVDVTSTMVQAPIYAVNGGRISGLQINALDGRANAPGRANAELSTAEPGASETAASEPEASETPSQTGGAVESEVGETASQTGGAAETTTTSGSVSEATASEGGAVGAVETGMPLLIALGAGLLVL